MSKKENKKGKGLVVIILLIVTGALSTSFLLPQVESQYSYDAISFPNVALQERPGRGVSLEGLVRMYRPWVYSISIAGYL